jgi:DNA-binding NtrC family response regulator
MPAGIQAKLLRAVELGEMRAVGSNESKQVDVYAIVATNRDLRTESEAGRIRPDLYYRLSVLELRLPALRDRREDIPYLAAAFIKEFAGQLNRSIRGMTVAAERLLQHAPWPGNVRQLRNVIQRACILSTGKMLTEREFAAILSATPAADALRAAAEEETASGENPTLLSTAQREEIKRVLRLVGGNKAAAAKQLGISRRSLYRWLDRLGIQ